MARFLKRRDSVNSKAPGLLCGISLVSALGALEASVAGSSAVVRHGGESVVEGDATTAAGEGSSCVWGLCVGEASWCMLGGACSSATSSGSEARGVLGIGGSIIS